MDVSEQEWLSQAYSSLKEKYVALVQEAPRAVANKKQIGILMERLSESDEKVRELEKEVKRLKDIIEKISGNVVVIQEGDRILGSYVHQKCYLRVLDKLKEYESKQCKTIVT